MRDHDSADAPQKQENAGETAAAYLRRLDPAGVHNLVAFDPTTDGPSHGRTFASGSFEEIAAWVNERDGRLNIYYTPNEVRPDFSGTKPAKSDIVAIRAIFADADPAPGDLEVERANVLERVQGVRAFTDADLVDSGGGYQLIAPLKTKLPADALNREWAESYGRGLAVQLGSDAVQNVDRLMRLPGAMNIPTPSKTKKGRVPRRAVVVRAHARAFPKSEIEFAVTPKAHAGREDKNPRISEVGEQLRLSRYEEADTFEDLPAALQEKFRCAVSADPALEKLWRGELPPSAEDNTGSSYRWQLALALGRVGTFDAEEFAQLAFAWPHAVQAGQDKYERLDPDGDGPRELARCWVKAAEPAIERLNGFFQVIDAPPDTKGFETHAKEAATAATAAKPERRQLPLITFEEGVATALTQSAKPLVKGLMDQGMMTVLYGPSNVGKTFVAMDLAFHIAHGEPWGGMKTMRTGVLYIAAEGGPGVRKRMRALRLRYPDLTGGDFFAIPASVDLLRPEADLQTIIDMIETIGADRIGLVVVDTLSRALAGGEENSTSDMGVMVKHLDIIRQTAQAHVFVVHHSGKDIAKGARGSSVLRAATDTEIEISEGEFRVTKQRDLDKNVALSFRLEGVTLGTDEDGDPITSATVHLLQPGETASIDDKPPTATEALVLEALRAGLSIADDAVKGLKPDALLAHLRNAGMEIRDHKAAVNTVRTHLSNLAAKGHVEAVARGIWAPKGWKTPSCELEKSVSGFDSAMWHTKESATPFARGVFQ